MDLPVAILECIAHHLQVLDEDREDTESSLVRFSCASRAFAEVARRQLLRSVYLAAEGLSTAPHEYFARRVAPQHGAHIKELLTTFGIETEDSEAEEEAQDEEALLEIVKRRQWAIAAALPHLVNLDTLALDVADGDPPLPPEVDPLFIAGSTLGVKSLKILPLQLVDDDPQIDAAYLAVSLPLFSSTLTSLDITGVANYRSTDMANFIDALQSLPSLTSLALRDSEIGPTITHGGWACSSTLTSLTLSRLIRLDLVDLEELIVRHFAKNLTTLSLHHYAPDDEESHALFDLPKLTTLEFESALPIRHLGRCFAASKATRSVKHLRMGSALHPWRNDENEGDEWKSALTSWDLESFTLLQGERCWTTEMVDIWRDWCEDEQVEFEVEEPSDYSTEETSEWESSEEGEGM